MQWLDAIGERGQRIKADVEAQFGKRVRDERLLRGWSQRELAERLDQAWGIQLDPSAITRLEKGTRPTRLNEAIGLAYTLGAETFDQLLDEPQGPTSVPEWIAQLKNLIADQEATLAELQRSQAAAEQVLTMNRNQLEQLERITELDEETADTATFAVEAGGELVILDSDSTNG